MNIELEPIDSVSRGKIVSLFHTIFTEPDIHWEIQKGIKESFKDVMEECSAVAWKGDKPVGAILTVDRDGLHIDHIGVLQNHRRMGIGRMLLRYAVDNADESIASKIPKDNQAVIELMEEEGFERVDEKEDHYLYRYDYEFDQE
ncbi:MAG: GNAT family N-acetyltransferase [Candidatus Aenigmatarchaeota archaeon]